MFFTYPMINTYRFPIKFDLFFFFFLMKCLIVKYYYYTDKRLLGYCDHSRRQVMRFIILFLPHNNISIP